MWPSRIHCCFESGWAYTAEHAAAHVLGEIDTLFLLELTDDVVDDALVEVFPTQEGLLSRQ